MLDTADIVFGIFMTHSVACAQSLWESVKHGWVAAVFRSNFGTEKCGISEIACLLLIGESSCQ